MPDSTFDNFSDTCSNKSWSDGEPVAVKISGLFGTVRIIKPGSFTQKGLFGTVREYKEGDCIHGGFTHKTRYVTGDGKPSPAPSPYSTPTSSPQDQVTEGITPPSMSLGHVCPPTWFEGMRILEPSNRM